MTTLTPTIHAQLVGARRVGAPLRHCAKAAGVPWRTLCDWLRKGREGHVDFAALARDLDAADAAIEQVLRARALKGTEKDARLAFDMLRWRESQEERKAELRLARAKATSLEAAAPPRAAGPELALPASLTVARTDPPDDPSEDL